MEPLELADSELYGSGRGFLKIQPPKICVNLDEGPNEILFLMVWTVEDAPNAIFLTKEQAIELRDYLNQAIEEAT